LIILDQNQYLTRCEFILIYLFECFNSKSEQIVSKSHLWVYSQGDFGNYWCKELAPKALKAFIFFYLHVKDHAGKFSYHIPFNLAPLSRVFRGYFAGLSGSQVIFWNILGNFGQT